MKRVKNNGANGTTFPLSFTRNGNCTTRIPEIRIEEIIREECHRLRVKVAELESGIKRQNVTAARETIALRCARDLGRTAAEIARHLGVGTSAITRAIERAGKKPRQGGEEVMHTGQQRP